MILVFHRVPSCLDEPSSANQLLLKQVQPLMVEHHTAVVAPVANTTMPEADTPPDLDPSQKVPRKDPPLAVVLNLLVEVAFP